MIRPEVGDFIALGRFPSEDGGPDEALEDAVERAGALFDLIERPVTDEEAHAMAGCFGDDECFGEAWVLPHLICQYRSVSAGLAPVRDRHGRTGDHGSAPQAS